MAEAEALRDLMEADRWIDRVAAQREHLPEAAELAAVEARLRELALELGEASATLAPLRGALAEAQRASERLRERERELGRSLATSTANARELAALSGELAKVREALDEAEDRELSLMEAIEPLEGAEAEIRQRAHPDAARRAELREVVEGLSAGLADELADLRARRAGLVGALTPATRERYERALARAGVSGAAQLVEGRCDGCRLRLSPADLDRLRELGEGQVGTCPECARLLLT